MPNVRQFFNIGALRPRRSAFDLSYTTLFDCDMGQLIPICCDEVVPGDHWSIGNEMIVRMQPMIAPVLHQIDVTTHFFFVPYRILDENWEEFITGGVDGEYAGSPPLLLDFAELSGFPTTKGGLLDFLGYPVFPDPVPFTEDNCPLAYPVFAYNRVYNEYYRDQNLQEEVSEENVQILYRSWEKDYFTSALPFLQRGTPPALPVNTFLDGEFITNVNTTVASSTGINAYPANAPFQLGSRSFVPGPSTNWLYTPDGVSSAPQPYTSGLGANTVSTASSTAESGAELTAISTSFNVSDLRLAFQIQKWQERNARAGVRYTEFLRAHYGTSPRDERLQRPEYIGGTKTPVIISEVLQTSATTDQSAQGNLAGHGITIDRERVGSYYAQEFGLIIGLLSIMPKPSYQSQGVNRQWLRRSRYDFYSPEFAHLSEQGIFNAEIFVTGTETDRQVFGFQGRYDEMRVKHNMVANNMRGGADGYFEYWHLARLFDNLPQLNEDFIKCNPSKRIFAVPTEPGFIVHYANKIKAIRPLPIIAEPGLIDHF